MRALATWPVFVLCGASVVLGACAPPPPICALGAQWRAVGAPLEGNPVLSAMWGWGRVRLAVGVRAAPDATGVEVRSDVEGWHVDPFPDPDPVGLWGDEGDPLFAASSRAVHRRDSDGYRSIAAVDDGARLAALAGTHADGALRWWAVGQRSGSPAAAYGLARVDGRIEEIDFEPDIGPMRSLAVVEDDVFAGGTEGRAYRHAGEAWFIERAHDEGSLGALAATDEGTLFAAGGAPDTDGDRQLLLARADGAWETLVDREGAPFTAIWASGPRDVHVASSRDGDTEFFRWDGEQLSSTGSVDGVVRALWGAGPVDVWAAGASASGLWRYGCHEPFAPTETEDAAD